MAKVYADLIRKGLKTIDDVPDKLKDDVQAILDADVQVHYKLVQKEGGRNGSYLCNTYHQGQEDFCRSS